MNKLTIKSALLYFLILIGGGTLCMLVSIAIYPPLSKKPVNIELSGSSALEITLVSKQNEHELTFKDQNGKSWLVYVENAYDRVYRKGMVMFICPEPK